MRSRRRKTAPFSLFAFQDIITSVSGIMILITMMLALEIVTARETAPDIATPLLTKRLEEAVSDNRSRIRELDQQLDAASQPLAFDSASLTSRLQTLREAREKLEQQQQALSLEIDSAERRRQQATSALETPDLERLPQLVSQLQRAQEQLQDLRTSNRVIFNRPEGETRTPWLLEISDREILAAEFGRTMKPLSFETPDETLDWARTLGRDSTSFVLLVKPSGVESFSLLREQLEEDGFKIGFDLLNADQQAIDRQTGADAP